MDLPLEASRSFKHLVELISKAKHWSFLSRFHFSMLVRIRLVSGHLSDADILIGKQWFEEMIGCDGWWKSRHESETRVYSSRTSFRYQQWIGNQRDIRRHQGLFDIYWLLPAHCALVNTPHLLAMSSPWNVSVRWSTTTTAVKNLLFPLHVVMLERIFLFPSTTSYSYEYTLHCFIHENSNTEYIIYYGGYSIMRIGWWRACQVL